MNGQPRPLATAPGAHPPQPIQNASLPARPANPPVGPNGQPLRRRRKAPVDPMRPVYRPMKTVARPVIPSVLMNDSAPKEGDGERVATADAFRQEFLQQPGAINIPLVVTRRDMRDLRHHIMRLQAKGRVDITDEKQFSTPIRLHRRDPRAPPSGGNAQLDEEDTKEDIEEMKERERLEIAKEERRKVRQENLAKIAPTGTKKHKKNKEKHAKHGDPSRKSSFAHLNDISKRGAASGSDSEMTDAGKSKHKLKVRLGGSPSGSPGGSRAGSPAAQVNGSRAGSPAASSAAPARKSSISQSGSSLLLTPPPAKTLPSAAEIYQALPAAGMTIQGLINRFKGRVDKSNTQAFIKLVKAVSSFDKQRSWLIPLPQMPSEEQVNKVIQGQKKPGASPS
jgi:hypothetical protein